MSVYYAERGLCNGRGSSLCMSTVCTSACLCPIDRQQWRLAAGLLLSALVAGDINRLLHGAVQQALALSSKCRLITDVGG